MTGWKILAAQNFLIDLGKKISPYTEIALRVFGKRHSDTCESSYLLAEMNTLETKKKKQDFFKLVARISTGGDTPLAHSLTEAEYDFYGDVEDRIVVLITDGEETCGGHPCDVSRSLYRNNDIRVNVVGIDMSRDTRSELECIANSGGGQYIDARNKAELITAIHKAAELPTVPLVIRIFDDEGNRLFGHIEIEDEYYNIIASTDEDLHEFSPSLFVGEYTVIAEVDGKKKKIEARLIEGKAKEIVFIF